MTNSSTESSSKVVFFGDSITQFWSELSPNFFETHAYTECGISGQTTPQMIRRFKEDVINLAPEAVVILAGTNDIACNTGPATNEEIQNNLKTMAEMANENGIKVILSSILPAHDYPWNPGIYPSQRIIEINKWIRNYSRENGHIYLDYWTSMADERNGLIDRFTKDGVHVTKDGYELMESLVQPAIKLALSE